MRLLLAISGLDPRDGGPPRVVVGSAIGLAHLGHEVTVISLVDPGAEKAISGFIRPAEEAGVKFVFVNPVGILSTWFPTRDGNLVEAMEAADVVHCHGVWSPFLLAVGCLAKARRKPYFVSSHGLFSPWSMRKSRLKKRLATLLLGVGRYCTAAQGVIFGTRGEYDVSRVPGGRIRPLFVPNGVDEHAGLRPVSAGDRALLRDAAPAVGNWKRTILFFARIHPKKGLDLLVEGFAEVAHRFPGTGLLIAGIRQDESFQRRIEQQIGQAAEVPIVLTTQLVGEKSQFLYAYADIFVLPSHEEGFSMALLEALAHGCPSLSTTLCHLPEIEGEGAGVVVEPTATDIGKGLARLLQQDDAELAAMGARARLLFEARFTWARVAQQLAAQYSLALS